VRVEPERGDGAPERLDRGLGRRRQRLERRGLEPDAHVGRAVARERLLVLGEHERDAPVVRRDGDAATAIDVPTTGQ
jgi:hypothetical protein